MLFHVLSYILYAAVLSSANRASAPQLTSLDASSPVVKNANHIFNAIHSSMRQWGSSLNHNSVSFFPAYIPAGTEFYHGRGDPDPVKGMEWLAFEPEHALQFAWNITWGNNTEAQTSQSPKWMYGSDLARVLLTQQEATDENNGIFEGVHDNSQRTLSSEQPSSEEKASRAADTASRSWLAPYKSAAKTFKGTLDSQDYVLVPGEPYALFDLYRATRMCKLAAKDWHGQIDGFIRMEHGFELILCDFPTHLNLVRVDRSITKVSDFLSNAAMKGFSFWRAITARYHSIGLGRVWLDYERMVTAFAYDIDLFSDQSELPRLKNISEEHRVSIMADLSSSVLHDSPDKSDSHPFDWQAVADMIVARYSNVLQELAHSPYYNSVERFEQASVMLMQPFIDSDHRNSTLESLRCALHFMPSTYTPSTASSAVSRVSEKICSTLNSAGKMQSLEDVRRRFQDLIEYLRWTSWKDCRGCRYDEICFTAIWPAGNVEDHIQPTCKNGTEILHRRGYWWPE